MVTMLKETKHIWEYSDISPCLELSPDEEAVLLRPDVNYLPYVVFLCLADILSHSNLCRLFFGI